MMGDTSPFRWRLPREMEPFVRQKARDDNRDAAQPERNGNVLHDPWHAEDDAEKMPKRDQEKFDPRSQRKPMLADARTSFQP